MGTDVRIEQLKNASALETRSFHLDLVTPLFVHGWHKAGDNNKTNPVSAEWRIPSWRGIMRYWWRTLQTDDPQTMRGNEEHLFGGTVSENARKSPVSFRFYSKINSYENNQNRNAICPVAKPGMKALAIPAGQRIDLKMYLAKRHASDIHFYESLCQYIFMLAGIGQRARRGSGSIQIEQWKDKNEFSAVLKNKLHQLGVAGHFKTDDLPKGILVERQSGDASHPILKHVYLGSDYNNAEEVRRAIDQAAKNANDPDNTQYLGSSRNPRFSSPLWCTVRRIGEHYHPVITELNNPHISKKEYILQRDLFLSELGVKI